MDPNHGDGDGIWPSDLLLDILQRLPRRALADSRRVCRAWRAIIDTHRLLLPYFFPADAFPGVFYNKYECWASSAFFAAAPSSRPTRHGKPAAGSSFRYPIFRHNIFTVQDHSNGLLLLRDGGHNLVSRYNCYVCNPATVRCALLPRAPPHGLSKVQNMFLAFDPAVSLHYQVFFLPEIKIGYIPRESSPPALPAVPLDGAPSEKVLSIQVYSSQTGEWEQRKFTPGRHCPRRLYDNMTYPQVASFMQELHLWCSAEYWRGSLYVHCRNNVLMILRCSAGIYDMVEFPGKPYPINRCLGSNVRGIRYASLDNFKVQAWDLVQSSSSASDGGELELGWTLAHEADLKPYMNSITAPPPPKVTWGYIGCSKGLFNLLDDEKTIRMCIAAHHEEEGEEEEDPEQHGWNWDDRNLLLVDVNNGRRSGRPISLFSGAILGFHPHRDVLLLEFDGTAVAYHLDASRRMQYLGDGLIDDSMEAFARIDGGFPYRPCYVDVLPAKRMSR